LATDAACGGTPLMIFSDSNFSHRSQTLATSLLNLIEFKKNINYVETNSLLQDWAVLRKLS
jgi:hypothetical protein